MAKDKRLGEQLEELAMEDPKVAKAERDLDRYMQDRVNRDPNYDKPIDEWTFDDDE